jgi:hypothetical protein
MNYPFEFKEMLLTDKVLDKLGFSEYWAGSGDFGERTFGEKINQWKYSKWYRIVEVDEMDDPESGYGYGKPEYCPQHYHSPFKGKVFRDIYFLHDLYEDISDNSPETLEQFIEKTKEKGVNMYPYIESYLKWKNEKNKAEKNK